MRGRTRERALLTSTPSTYVSTTDLQMRAGARRSAWFRLLAQAAVVIALICLAVANVAVRWTWWELEDGVLWRMQPEERRRGGTGARVGRRIAGGVRQGDVLLR